MVVVAVIASLVFLLLFYAMFGKTIEAEPKFKVVDKYNNCDVVQYTDPWGAKYHYFLHCNSL
jgi:hypothetical protein